MKSLKIVVVGSVSSHFAQCYVGTCHRSHAYPLGYSAAHTSLPSKSEAFLVYKEA